MCLIVSVVVIAVDVLCARGHVHRYVYIVYACVYAHVYVVFIQVFVYVYICCVYVMCTYVCVLL